VKLEIRGIQFAYNSKPVLNDIYFEVLDREVVGIIGPNGSGKSTLLKCINKILKPQVGTILLEEIEIDKIDRNDLAKKIGYVPQSESSKFPITVFDAILMGRKPYLNWRPSSQDLDKVAEMIEMLNLDEFAMRDIGAISGGQRQKVIMARALVQEPEALLLDEPTSNLDLRHQLEVLNIVRKQVVNGINVIVSIHDLNLAARYCDKLIMIKDGTIFAAGGPEILNSENIETVFGVKVSIINDSGRIVIIPEDPA
jgi:iron complex transport system ATP-binding protein